MEFGWRKVPIWECLFVVDDGFTHVEITGAVLPQQ